MGRLDGTIKGLDNKMNNFDETLRMLEGNINRLMVTEWKFLGNVNQEEDDVMSEQKIHVLPDDNLGGVLREYVEVEREAKDGDFAVFKTRYKGITLGKPYEINVTKPHGGMIKFYDDNGDEHWWDIPSEEFTIVEPTDIVHVDGVHYRLVDRKAKVGEKVLIIEANPYLVYKKVGEVVEILETNGDTFGGLLKDYDVGFKGAVYHFQYRVLEPIKEQNQSTDKIKEIYRLILEMEEKLNTIKQMIEN